MRVREREKGRRGRMRKRESGNGRGRTHSPWLFISSILYTRKESSFEEGTDFGVY